MAPKIFPKLAVIIKANELCSFAFSRLARASSLDNGRIVAAKKDIKRRKNISSFILITNTN